MKQRLELMALWITGGYCDYSKYDSINRPILRWRMAPTGEMRTFTFSMVTAPNFFHRAMSRILLGTRFEMIPPNERI